MRYAMMLIPLLAACSGAGAPTDPTPSNTGAATWHRDVEPLVQSYCLQCHLAGGSAPVALDTYANAKAWGPAVLSAVTNRTMPPYYAVGDGSCQTFPDIPWLSDAQIAVFQSWSDAAYPEGDPADAPAPFVPAEGLGAGALSYTMPAAYAPVISGSPSDPKDDYRCFLMSEGRAQDGFVTAFEAVPGNATVVHHLLAYTLDPDAKVDEDDEGAPITNREVIAALQAAEGSRGGWPCYGTAGQGTEVNGLVGSWAPGTGVLRVPEGTGVSMRGQDWLVVQIHYNLDNGAGTDQTTVKIQLEPSVEKEAYVVLPDGMLAGLADGDPFIIAPGESSVPFEWSGKVSDLSDYLAENYADKFETIPTEFDVYGAFPHMHALGKTFEATLTNLDTGASTCLMNMPRWDFNWQHLYLYEAPLRFGPEHEVSVRCVFDSRGRIEPTFPGPDSEDEMCMFGLYFTAR